MRMPKGACIRANGKPSGGASIGIPTNLLQVTREGRCTSFFLYTKGCFNINILKTEPNKVYAHASNY
jgi:hypothetical protein